MFRIRICRSAVRDRVAKKVCTPGWCRDQCVYTGEAVSSDHAGPQAGAAGVRVLAGGAHPGRAPPPHRRPPQRGAGERVRAVDPLHHPGNPRPGTVSHSCPCPGDGRVLDIRADAAPHHLPAAPGAPPPGRGRQHGRGGQELPQGGQRWHSDVSHHDDTDEDNIAGDQPDVRGQLDHGDSGGAQRLPPETQPQPDRGGGDQPEAHHAGSVTGHFVMVSWSQRNATQAS